MVSTETSTPSTQPAWDDALLRDPHAVADKRSRVQRMFAAIAPSYDLNNRLHSLGMDQRWRRKAVKFAQVLPTDVVVDVACGTGDLTLAMQREKMWGCAMRELNTTSPTIGVDFTFRMLRFARRKAQESSTTLLNDFDPRPLSDYVRFVNGDAQSLPLADRSCEVVSIAFGIRNVADPAAAVAEFYRVLRPGGRLIILEFSLPTNPFLRGLYNFYFRKILPRTATLVSGDKTGAYKYLPESVNTFIGREQMAGMMRGAGFAQVEQFPMTFGVCVCYRGVKEG